MGWWRLEAFAPSNMEYVRRTWLETDVLPRLATTARRYDDARPPVPPRPLPLLSLSCAPAAFRCDGARSVALHTQLIALIDAALATHQLLTAHSLLFTRLERYCLLLVRLVDIYKYIIIAAI